MLLLCHSPQVIPKPSPHVSPFRRYSIFCVKLCPASGMLYLYLLSTTCLAILQDYTTRSQLSVDTNIITTHLTIHEIFHISFEAVSSIRYVVLLSTVSQPSILLFYRSYYLAIASK
ncbi:hypothetical protein PISMIDRAFT_364964 [Pisolithus microcarpus 441]|uniref:Uncharacterized protein n=1 Tax=Pisolithus microcarpus 441 TaxID=765257 RepID=A0A0C9YAZ9_9AGAM|nr:hypothetical protein BKA83DRAFT_364964 [Pisolithus microcarpus]KIK13986.1 hypothetical protein PISMIDRAFT_364964 [Pisolithus microcarpus 441]